MNKHCLVCGAHDFKPIFNETLLKCGSCGFVTANIEIDPEILKSTYTENYFKGEEYLDYTRDKDILQMNFQKRLQYILKRIDRSEITHAIEIGCAYGFFAEVITEELKQLQYRGYDVVDEAVQYGVQELRQNLFCKDYLEDPIIDPVTDIFMWDVIEHLPYPHEVIQKAARELKPGGRIYITTGDIERRLPRLQGAKWRMIHPPSHLHYFSKKTLTALLRNYGLELKYISYPPIYRSVKAVYYSLFMLRKKYGKAIEKIYRRIPSTLNFAVNTYDIMFLIAQKEQL
jgi:SAM-dependent methyltransferase